MITNRPLAASAVLLLSIAAAGHCDLVGQFSDRLPAEYEFKLSVLEFALANSQPWSMVWDELLTPDGLNAPTPEFCDSAMIVRVTDTGTDATDNNSSAGSTANTTVTRIETFATVKEIVNECYYSGMYVDYGFVLLGRSVQCLFQKHAMVHLSTVIDALANSDDGLKDYVNGLIGDYYVIVDKMAVLGLPLRVAFDMMKKFKDLAEGKDQSVVTLRALKESINKDCERFCASPNTSVSLKENNNQDQMKNSATPSAEESTSTPARDATPVEGPLSRAQELRKLSRKVFDDLLIKGMPSAMWEEFFKSNIFYSPKNQSIQKPKLSLSRSRK